MKDFEDVVNRFVGHVREQRRAFAMADSPTANKHAKAYLKIFYRLCEYGDRGRDALCPLLSHADREVRCAAAVLLLRYKHDEALSVLSALSRGRDLISLEAQECMKRWEEGEWDLDPDLNNDGE